MCPVFFIPQDVEVSTYLIVIWLWNHSIFHHWILNNILSVCSRLHTNDLLSPQEYKLVIQSTLNHAEQSSLFGPTTNNLVGVSATETIVHSLGDVSLKCYFR